MIQKRNEDGSRPATRDEETGDLDMEQSSLEKHGVEGVPQAAPQFVDLEDG